MYGLLGKKLNHSHSPFVHNSLCRGIDYSLIEIEEDKLENFLIKKEFSGINVTFPYKEKVIDYLDELNWTSKTIGSVNLIINKDNKLIGYNTDYYGFKESLKKYNFNVTNKKCLILGTGGTAKTIRKVLIDCGAKEIYLVSRSNKKGTITYKQAEQKFDSELIFNATPYGLYPNIENKALINIDKFPYLEGVGDVIFNPLKTQLLFDAKKRGIPCFNGLFMLIKQAELSEKIIGNKIINKSEKIYKKLLINQNNIVLIGMPFSGKTTAGRNLARRLKKEHIDVDKYIEEKIGMSIPEYFKTHKEQDFRKIEFDAIKEISERKNAIISCGGGTILSEKNMNILLQNGLCVFLNKNLELLKEKANSDTRPLLKEKSIEELYKERINLYKKYADITINNNGSKESTLNMLMKELI